MQNKFQDPTRRNRRHISVVSTVAALMLAVTSAAHAQSCYELRQQRSEIQGREARLVADHPDVHLVGGLCAAGAMSVYESDLELGMDEENAQAESIAAFATCAVIGCAFAGFGRCGDVVTTWYQLGLESEQLDHELSRQQCPQ